MTRSLDIRHALHLAGPSVAGDVHLLIDDTSRMALPAAPEISISLPVRRTILSAEPVRHMASTMQRMHSSEPGTGVSLHPRQSITSMFP